ncbi:MAG: hypothetical protein H0T73_07100, partial [Ardenticatenales bacterium]|nr:hypothetical protein [Ardenticatenales bacterium]
MKLPRVRPIIVAFAVVIALFIFVGLTWQPEQASREGNVVTLIAPAFLGAASAAPDAPMAFPVDEAGISAYFKASSTVDLAQ